MAEKEGAKKWLVLLVILVALSLVVDLLYLNVLYDIAESSDSGLIGGLKTFETSETSASCEENCYAMYPNKAQKSSLNSCLNSCCKDDCSNEIYHCLVEAGLSYTHCYEERRRCHVDCNSQYPT